MDKPTSGSRIQGTQCAGRCKHSSTYHMVKLVSPSGIVEYGCAKVDCPCMKFVESGTANTDAR